MVFGNKRSKNLVSILCLLILIYSGVNNSEREFWPISAGHVRPLYGDEYLSINFGDQSCGRQRFGVG